MYAVHFTRPTDSAPARYGVLNTATPNLWVSSGSGQFDTHVWPTTLTALFNDGAAEHEYHWSTTPEGTVPFLTTPVPEEPVEERTAQGKALATMRERERALTAQVASLTDRVRQLQYSQISGDDHRLSDFWTKAQELADEAGHCEVFDNLAAQLDGPRREKEYRVMVDVTITLSVSVSVMATDSEAAESLVDEDDVTNQIEGYSSLSNYYSTGIDWEVSESEEV